MLDLYDPMVCFGPDTRSLQWPHRHVPAAPAGFAVWQALQTKIDFPFGDGTSLANALNHIKQQVGKSAPPGFQLNIYVDPIGLLEADKSPASPVTLELEAVPANSGLALLLRQLGLAHFVRDDGIVVIDPELSEVFPHDRDYEVLHQIQILSAEVDQLKALLSVAAESRTNPQGEAAGPARKAQ